MFELPLTRRKILQRKLFLERVVRTDKDIHEAVLKWLEDPVVAERRCGHISDWDVSRVTNMWGLLAAEYDERSDEYVGAGFNEDLSKWDTGNVTNMSAMFGGATSFNSDLSEWDTGKVAYMEGMFYCASSFNSDLSNWDTGKVEDVEGMFDRTTSLEEEPAWYKTFSHPS